MTGKLIKSEIYHNVSMAGLCFFALLFLFGRQQWWPSYYSPHFFGSAFIISAGLVLLARSIFRSDDTCRMNAAYFLRFAITTALVINAAGELYFYQLYRFGFQYDKFAHLANSLLFILSLASFGRSWYGLSPAKSLRASIAIVVICGIGWEVIEFASDKIFNTKVFGIYGQLKLIDTIFDLIYDLLGITLAAIMDKSFHFRLRMEIESCDFPSVSSGGHKSFLDKQKRTPIAKGSPG